MTKSHTSACKDTEKGKDTNFLPSHFQQVSDITSVLFCRQLATCLVQNTPFPVVVEGSDLPIIQGQPKE